MLTKKGRRKTAPKLTPEAVKQVLRLLRAIGHDYQLPLAEDIPTKCNLRNSRGGVRSILRTFLGEDIIVVGCLCEYKDTWDDLQERSVSVHNRTSSFSRTYLGT